MEATLLIADRPNANGHIYSKEAIEQVKLQIEEHITSGIAFGVIHKDAQTPVLKLVDAAFRIEHPRIIENELKIDIIPISTSNGDLLKQNLNQFKFSMVGMGTINDDGTIDNVRYCYSSAILKY